MKTSIILSLCFLVAGISVQGAHIINNPSTSEKQANYLMKDSVENEKAVKIVFASIEGDGNSNPRKLNVSVVEAGEESSRKPVGSSASPPKMGWRLGNGPCVCKNATGTMSSPPPMHPSAPHRPLGHNPPGSHGSPRHHQGPQGSHGQHPHNGPHGHPPRRPKENHGPKGHHGDKHRKGPHGHGPTHKHKQKEQYRKCVCNGKPAERDFKIKFRMLKKWHPEMADHKSKAYMQLAYKLISKLSKVLQTGFKNLHNMRFTKGSIVVQFEVKESEIKKDPEKALRDAIRRGQLIDFEIDQESLVVSQTYSGVQLTNWETDEGDCARCGTVTQTRECIEVTASCEGIPLTRNASCYEACPQARITTCGGHRGFRKAKMMVVACLAIVGVILIVAILVITKVKRARRKYLKTSPSTSSIKQLADDDKLEKSQSKC